MKILNYKEKEIFNYTIRPFMIYCIIIAFIVIIGSNFCNMSSDTINGYINSMVIIMLTIYFNLSYIEIKNIEKK